MSASEAGGSVERVRAALRAAGHPDTITQFPAGTRTAADAAAAVGCTVAQIAKSLVFKTRQTHRPVLVIASGVSRVNEAALGTLLGEPVDKAGAYAIQGLAHASEPEGIEQIVERGREEAPGGFRIGEAAAGKDLRRQRPHPQFRGKIRKQRRVMTR